MVERSTDPRTNGDDDDDVAAGFDTAVVFDGAALDEAPFVAVALVESDGAFFGCDSLAVMSAALAPNDALGFD